MYRRTSLALVDVETPKINLAILIWATSSAEMQYFGITRALTALSSCGFAFPSQYSSAVIPFSRACEAVAMVVVIRYFAFLMRWSQWALYNFPVENLIPKYVTVDVSSMCPMTL